jgi:uncharacterized SAM-binding protein YcdF (DUF218 family)
MTSKGKWRLKVALLTAVMVGLALLALPSSWILSGLTVHDALIQSDAIVLLAGEYQERAPAAAMLYRDGYAPSVVLTNDGIFSSWSNKYGRNLYQVEWATEELIKLGVPRDKIIQLPFYGSSTLFDALAVKRHLFKSGQKKIILVTSDYHTRRTLWTFKQVLKEYPTQITVYPARSFGANPKSLAVECVKFAFYLTKYGVLGLVPAANEVKPSKG